jgi:hypothetical protein
MNTKNQFFLLLILLLVASCGQVSETQEETCSLASCSERDLNALVAETGDDKSSPQVFSLSKINYRMPVFSSKWGLRRKLYEKTIRFFDDNYKNIPNRTYVTIVDFGLSSSKKRLFLFNLENGTVEKHLVSHGAGSDPDNDTFATLFSNEPESKKSSLGFYLTLSTYIGRHGYSLKIRGLQSSNSNAESRAIVIHPALYVSEREHHAGRSWGCPALDPNISKSVIDRLRSGSLILIDN